MIEKSIFKDGANKNLTHPKEQKGITLIALIITIIILLILAGVTIAMLSGENSILNKVNSAKTENVVSTEEEAIKLAVMTALSNNTKIENAKTIDDNLDDKWTVTGADGGPYTCKNIKTNNTYTIDINGIISSGSVGGDSIHYGEKYQYKPDGESYFVSMIFSEKGEVIGEIFEDSLVTYEVKSIHVANIDGIETEFQNAIFFDLEGMDPFFWGYFNYDFTDLTLLDSWEPDENGIYKDKWLDFTLESESKDIYENVYELGYNALTLYKNGMFTIYTPVLPSQINYTGKYTISDKNIEINGMFSNMDINGTISDDLSNLNLNCEGITDLTGNWVLSETYSKKKYSPRKSKDHGIYIGAIYVNEDESNAIVTTNKCIWLEQSSGGATDYIEFEDFDKATNTTISINDNGTVISYNGKEYTLITEKQMDTALN